ncbi:DNA polymerase III subunit epsilon [Woodsholea maritima]|uniref:DNA polymerase III subunit epsilon n=1 Tax=Woodsholea maritima TaxID=240237 RepID=UPI000363615D|nr:DNA polymerase III subunit epsilon [Woodsholea maritima]
MAREIIFDTETTGFHAQGGDRITELGCVEVIDMIPTGRDYRQLINPERIIPKEVTQVTGHTNEMLKDCPKFHQIADDFIEFVGDSVMVAHNAPFDMGFINMEMARLGKPTYPVERFKDTAAMARTRFPGAPASLDALCKRFNVSLESRTKHGALIDAYLLAEVYLELNGGRERRLEFHRSQHEAGKVVFPKRPARPNPLAPFSTTEEHEAHKAFLAGLPSETLWQKLGGL